MYQYERVLDSIRKTLRVRAEKSQKEKRDGRARKRNPATKKRDFFLYEETPEK